MIFLEQAEDYISAGHYKPEKPSFLSRMNAGSEIILNHLSWICKQKLGFFVTTQISISGKLNLKPGDQHFLEFESENSKKAIFLEQAEDYISTGHY